MKKVLLMVIALLLVLFLIVSITGTSALETTCLRFVSDELPVSFEGFRIVQISDLHDALLGNENRKLIEAVKAAEPDLIVITGDFIDARRFKPERSLNVARELTGITEVYYINGNHEASIPEEDYRKVTDALREAGVTVLEDEATEITCAGEKIRLIGLNDIGFHEGEVEDKETIMQQKLVELCSADGFNLVLSHRPELMNQYTQTEADLVLSGHAHGGQFRLPLIGGLFAPGQGVFPKYTSGEYRQGNTAMIVSRGIGNSSFPLRFNNRPEVVVIEFEK